MFTDVCLCRNCYPWTLPDTLHVVLGTPATSPPPAACQALLKGSWLLRAVGTRTYAFERSLCDGTYQPCTFECAYESEPRTDSWDNKRWILIASFRPRNCCFAGALDWAMPSWVVILAHEDLTHPGAWVPWFWSCLSPASRTCSEQPGNFDHWPRHSASAECQGFVVTSLTPVVPPLTGSRRCRTRDTPIRRGSCCLCPGADPPPTGGSWENCWQCCPNSVDVDLTGFSLSANWCSGCPNLSGIWSLTRIEPGELVTGGCGFDYENTSFCTLAPALQTAPFWCSGNVRLYIFAGLNCAIEPPRWHVRVTLSARHLDRSAPDCEQAASYQSGEVSTCVGTFTLERVAESFSDDGGWHVDGLCTGSAPNTITLEAT
jgi:hypothetical protein